MECEMWRSGGISARWSGYRSGWLQSLQLSSCQQVLHTSSQSGEVSAALIDLFSDVHACMHYRASARVHTHTHTHTHTYVYTGVRTDPLVCAYTCPRIFWYKHLWTSYVIISMLCGVCLCTYICGGIGTSHCMYIILWAVMFVYVYVLVEEKLEVGTPYIDITLSGTMFVKSICVGGAGAPCIIIVVGGGGGGLE